MKEIKIAVEYTTGKHTIGTTPEGVKVLIEGNCVYEIKPGEPMEKLRVTGKTAELCTNLRNAAPPPAPKETE